LQWRGGLPKTKTALQIKPKLKLIGACSIIKIAWNILSPRLLQRFSVAAASLLSTSVCTPRIFVAELTFVLYNLVIVELQLYQVVLLFIHTLSQVISLHAAGAECIWLIPKGVARSSERARSIL